MKDEDKKTCRMCLFCINEPHSGYYCTKRKSQETGNGYKPVESKRVACQDFKPSGKQRKTNFAYKRSNSYENTCASCAHCIRRDGEDEDCNKALYCCDIRPKPYHPGEYRSINLDTLICNEREYMRRPRYEDWKFNGEQKENGIPNAVAFIKDNSWFFYYNPNMKCGTHNGYVAIPPSNKYYMMEYQVLEHIQVHGGVTFSGRFSEILDEFEDYQEEIEFITENNEIRSDWWIFGFDTFHYGDNSQNWDKLHVVDETMKLLEQLTK